MPGAGQPDANGAGEPGPAPDRVASAADPVVLDADWHVMRGSAAPTGSPSPTEETSGPAPADPQVRQALEGVRARLKDLLPRVRAHVDQGTLPLLGWGLSRPRVQTMSLESSDRQWSVIGDIHGDFVAWHRLFERVRADPDFRLLFLGDLVDRGPHSLECLAALLEAVLEHPNRILWIVGNHDEALQFERFTGRFRSGVEPAEFLLELAQSTPWAPREARTSWGTLFVEIVRRLPRAVLFRDGTLATHGGVPLHDRRDCLRTLEAFHDETCLRDFTWTRAAGKPLSMFPTERRAQGSSDFQFGYKDLDRFVDACGTVLEVPIRRLLRGHDHVQHGVDRPAGYVRTPVLTLNGFGFHHLDNSLVNYRPTLALGRMRPVEPMQEIRVEDVPVESPAYIVPAAAAPSVASSEPSAKED